MRVQSNRPTENGWWHRGDSKPKPVFIPKPEPETPSIDAERLVREWKANTCIEDVALLANNLGVSRDSLTALEVVKSPMGSWGFPMRDGNGRAVGIRLRLRDGRKLSVKGGREGLFVPFGRARTAFVLEGPTDCAAALTIGLWAIGRPSCRGGIAHTQVAVNRLRIERIIIIGDNDLPKWDRECSPGIEGARAMAQELQVPVASMLLPTKDFRQFVIDGGTIDVIKSLERGLVWRFPTERT